MKLNSLFEAKKLPTWANDPDGEELNNAIIAGNWGKYKIKVSDRAPGVIGDNWGGFWSITPQGECTIYLETSLVKAARKKKALWALSHTLKHEKLEIEIAIKLARKKFPDRNPYVMTDLVDGLAHELAIKELDDMTERKYMKNLDIELEFLGL